MNIMAIEARNSAPIHHALNEVIPLHAVLMRGAVSEMHEAGLAERMILETPKVFEVATSTIADGPIS
jgi:hypothetical protein